MNKFLSGFKGTFKASALGAWFGVFVLLVLVTYIGYSPESVAAKIRDSIGA